MLAWLTQQKEKADEQITGLYQHARRTAIWKGTVSEEEFNEQWQEAKQVKGQVQKRNEDIARIRVKVSEI